MNDMEEVFLYTVRQFNEKDEEVSLLETSSPVVAISDFTIKTKMYYKNDLSREVTVQQMPGTEGAEIIKMISIVIDKESEIRESVIYLETNKVSTESEITERFSEQTIKRYKSESYVSALSEVANNFLKLSGGNIEIMKIISVIAGKDPSHELWRPRKPGKKSLSLG
ncbi:hypothetical protein AKG60_24865 [Vibrio parahaemolyticus]|uniref:Uncharacterized protein n=1 Tax=Vibrio parahaemolyticus TaxID=670 RepID=A0AAX0M6N8_VIBPH|nr:hypothetical protein [Vibrio parahaemolyticus]EJG0024475.1 hypothetical protein [Vibrio parahaemolyticus]OQJ96516.1 hypothetical protein AKG60_24865 [Vibrio parahaemolyticus]